MALRSRRRSRSRRHKSRRRRGGMAVFAPNHQMTDALDIFMDGATFKLLTKGSYGVTLIATQSDPLKQPFKKLDYAHFGEPVTTLLIKLSAIHTISKNQIYFNTKSKGMSDNDHLLKNSIDSVTENAFLNEIQVQNNLVRKTIEYLDPLYPCIIHSTIVSSKDAPEVPEGLPDGSKDRRFLPKVVNIEDAHFKFDYTLFLTDMFLPEKKCRMGIIFMEFMEGYETLYKFREKREKLLDNLDNHLLQNIYYYIVLETARLGYNHDDFHYNNVMVKRVDNENEQYFKGIPFHFVLIDFGNAIKMDNFTIDHSNYKKSMEQLCKTCSKRNKNATDSLCDMSLFDHSIIKKLYDARQQTIEFRMNNPIHYDELQVSPPGFFPKLRSIYEHDTLLRLPLTPEWIHDNMNF